MENYGKGVTREDIAEIYDSLAKHSTSLDDVAKFETRAVDVRKNDRVTSPYIADHILDVRNAGQKEFRLRARMRKKSAEARSIETTKPL